MFGEEFFIADLLAGGAAEAASLPTVTAVAGAEAALPTAGAVGDAIGSTADSTTPGMASALSGLGSLYSSAQSRSFQRDMSNTSYQRAVADLKAAGLNPMLAYSQGGASTPNWTMPNFGSDAVHSGVAAAQQQKQSELLDAQIAKTNEDAFLSHEQGRMYAAEAAARVEQLGSTSAAAQASGQLSLAQIPKVRAEVEQLGKQGALTQAQVAQANAQTSHLVAQAQHLGWSNAHLAQQISESIARIGNLSEERKLTISRTILSQLEQPEARAKAAFHGSKYGQVRPYLLDMGAGISGAADAARKLVPFMR